MASGVRSACLANRSEKVPRRPKLALGVVPIDQDPPALRRRQQRQPRDPLLGIGDDCLQQRLQMRRHSRNRGGLKEIGAVLEPATQTLVRVDKLERQIEPRDTGVHVHEVRGQSRKRRGPATTRSAE